MPHVIPKVLGNNTWCSLSINTFQTPGEQALGLLKERFDWNECQRQLHNKTNDLNRESCLFISHQISLSLSLTQEVPCCYCLSESNCQLMRNIFICAVVVPIFVKFFGVFKGLSTYLIFYYLTFPKYRVKWIQSII